MLSPLHSQTPSKTFLPSFGKVRTFRLAPLLLTLHLFSCSANVESDCFQSSGDKKAEVGQVECVGLSWTDIDKLKKAIDSKGLIKLSPSIALMGKSGSTKVFEIKHPDGGKAIFSRSYRHRDKSSFGPISVELQNDQGHVFMEFGIQEQTGKFGVFESGKTSLNINKTPTVPYNTSVDKVVSRRELQNLIKPIIESLDE